MTSQEATRLEELLAPSRIVVVATVGAGGMPQLTPNWYVYQGGRMAISTTKERIKYRNLSRDDRMAVCVYTEPGASDYVAITGRVTIADDESIWPVTQAIVERYVAPDGVDARMRTLRTENRVIHQPGPGPRQLPLDLRRTSPVRSGGGLSCSVRPPILAAASLDLCRLLTRKAQPAALGCLFEGAFFALEPPQPGVE